MPGATLRCGRSGLGFSYSGSVLLAREWKVMFPALLLCGLGCGGYDSRDRWCTSLSFSSLGGVPCLHHVTWPQLLLSAQCEEKGPMLLGPWCIVGSSSAAASVFSMELTALCSLP